MLIWRARVRLESRNLVWPLTENARHSSIKKAAKMTVESVDSFADTCNDMDYQHAVVAKQVRSLIEIYMAESANQNLRKLGETMAAAAKRADFAAINGALEKAAVAFDTSSKQFLGDISLETLLIGSLIDVANAFVNLHETRNVAMQRYTKGKEPHGWKNRLPRPLVPVFTEITCITLEKGVEVFLGRLLRESFRWVLPSSALVNYLLRSAKNVGGYDSPFVAVTSTTCWTWRTNWRRLREQHNSI